MKSDLNAPSRTECSRVPASVLRPQLSRDFAFSTVAYEPEKRPHCSRDSDSTSKKLFPASDCWEPSLTHTQLVKEAI